MIFTGRHGFRPAARAAAVLAVLALAACLCACGAGKGGGTGLVNPVVNSSAQEILEKLGLDLTAPEGAQDVAYSIVGDEMAQITFTADGVGWTLRVRPADALEDISGMHYTWQNAYDAEICRCPGTLAWNDGGPGTAVWYDIAPGLLWCVSMNSGADRQALESMAERAYIPMQGDVG